MYEGSLSRPSAIALTLNQAMPILIVAIGIVVRAGAGYLSLPHPEKSQCLTAGRGDQPAADAFGLGDPIEVLDQTQPGGLVDVGGIGGPQTVTSDHRPDRTGVPVDESLPRRLIAYAGHSREVGVACDHARPRSVVTGETG